MSNLLDQLQLISISGIHDWLQSVSLLFLLFNIILLIVCKQTKTHLWYFARQSKNNTGKFFIFAINLSTSRSKRYLSPLLRDQSRRIARSSPLFHWVLHRKLPSKAHFDRGYKPSYHFETSLSRTIHLSSHWKSLLNQLAKTTSRENKKFTCH